MNSPEIMYQAMLVKMSDEILNREEHGVDMLKFAYSDFASLKINLDKAETSFELFQILETSNILQQTNATILFETIELLGLAYLKDILNTNGFRYHHSRIALFTPYRQRIIRFGRALLQADVENIGSVCGVPKKSRYNQWMLLQYLQDKCHLSEQTVAQFIEAIKGIGVNIDVINPRIDETEEAVEISRRPIVQQETHEVQANRRPIPETLAAVVSDEPQEFKDLLALVNRWFQRSESVNKVKIILKDILKEHCNANLITTFSELFERLYLAGNLRPMNLTVMYDIIICTGQWGLEWEIRKLFPTCPNLSQLRVAMISEYRLRLIKFGNALKIPDWEQIDGACNFPRKRYRSAWSMIIDLEEKGEISEDRIGNFIAKLVRHGLPHAAEALR